MLSFIIPAYNEELLIGRTLESIRLAADAAGEPFEIIVVNDGSTDRTADVAAEYGARVITVKLRHIAAVRNAGARVAQGDTFIFVDADTLLPETTLRAALQALADGAVGGGSAVGFEGTLPLAARIYLQLFLLVWRPLRLAAGCFVFCRRDAFEAVGGFDERYYASEEIWLSKALKKQGRFVIVPEKVITSGRKGRMYSTLEFLKLTLVLVLKGPRAWQKRQGLDLWYDGRREVAASVREPDPGVIRTPPARFHAVPAKRV